jgi:hypothetical protein
MLRALQADGRLQKVATDNIIMTPTSSAEIALDQLNLIGNDKGALYFFDRDIASLKGAPAAGGAAK